MKRASSRFFAGLFMVAAILHFPSAGVAGATSAETVIGGHNSRGDTVVSIQLRLRDLGYFNYKITGQYGKVTQEAVAAFQGENGLHPDGRVGLETMDMLFSNGAKRSLFNARKAAVTPTPEPTPEPTPKPTKKADKTKEKETDKATPKKATPTPKKTEKSDKSEKSSDKKTAKPTATPKKSSKNDDKNTKSSDKTSDKSSDKSEEKKSEVKEKATPKPTKEPSRATPKPTKKPESDYEAPREAAPGYGRMADWSEVSGSWGRGETVVVKDLWTGIQYRMYRQAGHNHVDAEPATSEDNDAFLRTYGGKWSWDRRPVLVKINGEWIAGSTNGMPHGADKISGNGMKGQICIHFLNSRTHNHNAKDPDHMRCVRLAAGQ